MATWNVYNWAAQGRRTDGHFRPAWPKPEVEKAALRRVLHRLRADVVLFQEMGDAAGLEELRRDLASEGLHYPWGRVMEAGDGQRRLALLSRIPWREVHEHHPLAADGDERVARRGLLEAVFPGPEGRPLHLFTVHLKSSWVDRRDPEATVPEDQRTTEATLIRECLRKRFGDALPESLVLLAGDLNALADEPALRRLQRRGRTVLLVPLPASDPSGAVWTWSDDRRGLYTRFDWILVTPALLPYVAGATAWIPADPDIATASDHRPVVVDLHWPER